MMEKITSKDNWLHLIMIPFVKTKKPRTVTPEELEEELNKPVITIKDIITLIRK